MALLTTFVTTPLVSFLYPPWYQRKLEAWKRGEIDWDTGAPVSGNTSGGEGSDVTKPVNRVRRMLVYLRLDSMPATLNLPTGPNETSTGENGEKARPGSSGGPTGDSLRSVRAHGLRLLALGDRDSNVMTVSQVEDHSNNDTLLNIFRTVGQFLKIAVSGEAAVMPESRFAEALLTKSADITSDLVVVPWSETGNLGDSLDPSPEGNIVASPYTVFASTILGGTEQNIGIFFPRARASAPTTEPTSPRGAKLSRTYSFSDLHRDIPIIPVANVSHHIFVPYFGGSDDELALSLVLQLCEKASVTAQITAEAADARDLAAIISAHATSEAAARITVENITATKLTETALGQALSHIRPDANGITWHNLIIVGRRAENRTPRNPEAIKECLGIIAAHYIASSVKADLLVVQSRSRH